jgi:DNA polymerase-3 subunit epsilon
VKIFHFDCETTGLDPAKHGITQLAYILEVDGHEKAVGCLYANPSPCVINDEALKIQGLTLKELEDRPPAAQMYNMLIDLFDTYVDKFDKEDKFFAAGYNVGFDMNFLRALFRRFGNNYLGSYFYYPVIDPAALLPWLLRYNLVDMPVNFKLSTVAELLGLQLSDAHDAIADIRATKEVSETCFQRIADYATTST